MAIVSFRDQASEDICEGTASRKARSRLPAELHAKARIRLASLAAATSLADLRDLKGNRLEALKGKRVGEYSVRINDQYCICFRWRQGNAFEVEVVDYH